MNKLSLAFCAALLAAQAHAATISGPSAPSPTTAGTGLNGQFWDVNASMSNNAAALRFTTATPTATFLATTVDYTSTHTSTGTSMLDSNSLATFLGANASKLQITGSHTLDTSVYLFTGWLNVTQNMDTVAGGNIDVNFRVGSDDGMKLTIGGVTVTQYDTPRAYGFSSGTASFTSAGLYPISLLFYENYGYTGVDMTWQTSAAAVAAGRWTDVATANLYASLPVSDASGSHVPEPATLALVGLGAILSLRTRKQTATKEAEQPHFC